MYNFLEPDLTRIPSGIKPQYDFFDPFIDIDTIEPWSLESNASSRTSSTKLIFKLKDEIAPLEGIGEHSPLPRNYGSGKGSSDPDGLAYIKEVLFFSFLFFFFSFS